MLQFFKPRWPQGADKFLPPSPTSSTPDDHRVSSTQPLHCFFFSHLLPVNLPSSLLLATAFASFVLKEVWSFPCGGIIITVCLFVCLFSSESSARNTHVLHLARDQTNFLFGPLQYQMPACHRVTSSTVT